MVFKLIIAASKTWRRLSSEKQLPKVIEGVRFQDRIEIIETPSQNAASITAELVVGPPIATKH
jgi:putative transposase